MEARTGKSTEVWHERDEAVRRGYQVIRRLRNAPFRFRAHYHDALEIILARDAAGLVNIEGTAYAVSAKGFLALLIPPDVVHAIDLHGRKQSYSQVTLRISLDCFSDLVRAVSRYSDGRIAEWAEGLGVRSCDEATAELFDLVERLTLSGDCRWGLEPAYPANQCAEALSDTATLARIVRVFTAGGASSAEGAFGRPSPLRRIVDIVERNFDNPLSVAGLAELCGISKSHLCRLVHRQMGATVKEYVNTVRIEHAQHALRNTGESVSRIAFRCGFSSPTYFARVFSEQVGESPSRWRRSHAGREGALPGLQGAGDG